ncbi:MAG: NADH-quinone oxidoreductase subunit NuoE [Candidatus Cloacimonetes bacterium]|nr:NADH-quinone oxidoreductase subunit NuoE [Candidatus Cloacimonadota bacterium]
MKNWETIDSIIDKYGTGKGALIPLLQDVQESEGYLSRETMQYVAEKTGIGAADIYGVATFYTMFRLKPQGKHTIRVCKGTACHVSGANTIMNAIKNELKLTGDEDTTKDQKFTVFEVACLGCCSLAPVIMIDKTTYGKLNPDKIAEIIATY